MPPEPVGRRCALRIAGDVGLLASGLALALVLGECVVRVAAPQQRALTVALRNLHQPDSELGYVMVPGFHRHIRTPEFECDVRTNSLGMYDREPGPGVPGRLRVLGLGDSFVFGVHAGALERCFLKQLESELDAELRAQPIPGSRGRTWSGIELLNAGVDGYGTLQEVGLLERLGPALEPDAVLLCFYLGNDFTDNSGRTRMTVVDGYQMLEASARGYRTHFARPDRRLRVWLHANSELYLLLKRRLVHPARPGPGRPDATSRADTGETTPDTPALAGAVPGAPVPAPGPEATPAGSRTQPFEYFVYDSGFAECLREHATPQLEQSLRATRDALLRVRAWCDAHGATALLVAIPAEQQVDPAAQRAWIQRFGLDPNELDFTLPNRRLAALAEEAGIPIFDLTPALAAHGASTSTLYLRTDTHWNGAGHAAAAAALHVPAVLSALAGAPSVVVAR